VFSCNQFQEELPQYVADGERPLPQYDALRAHLQECASCRDHVDRLRLVEGALYSYPRMAPDPTLTDRILLAIAEHEIEAEDWRPLPWDVWVPALAFIATFLVIMFSFPSNNFTLISVRESKNAFVSWSELLHNGASLWEGMGTDLLWAIWSGIFATIAGLGLGVSITCWNELQSSSVHQLEERLTDTVHRLWGRARHIR